MHESTPETAPIPNAGRKLNFRQTLKQHLLHPEKTSGEVALSFAIGCSIAWNPLLGLHTLLVVFACFCSKRLHRPLMLAAAFLNNPWTLVPIATTNTYVGNILLGRGLHLDLQVIQWHTLGWRSFLTREGFEAMFRMLKPILAPYFLGGTVVSLVFLAISYFAMRAVAERLRRIHPHHPSATH